MRETVSVRFLIPRDMPDVLEIERASFDRPWNEDDFRCGMRQRNCIGLVAERHGEIVGFMIYELQKAKLVLLNLAVAPNARLQWVGHRLVRRLQDKVSQQRRKAIEVTVSDDNLDAHLFLRSQGFKAVAIERGYYEDGEDAYVFRFEVQTPVTAGGRDAVSDEESL